MTDLLFSPSLNRRVFVRGLGYVSLGVILGTVGGCDLDKILEAIANRPMRRRLRVGSPEVDADIATYAQAVTLMKALGDGRSWNSQAAIHGTAGVGFKWCQHGTAHFFDWHRAYLLYFERICQKVTGNARFGLPYWNWNQNPDINPAFLNTASSLFMARSHTSMAGQAATGSPTLNTIFADTNFFTFWQQIEGTPHNTVHGYIGATMGGYGSAMDPIFWTHHCMIDYCWAKWNIDLGNDNTSDTTWLDHNNEHFVDADNNPASMIAGLTPVLPLLSYQYESSPIGSAPATMAMTSKRAFQQLERRIRAGADIKFVVKERIAIAERAAITLARPFSRVTTLAPGAVGRIVHSDTAQERLFASVEFARLPRTSDYSVRVFVNLPGATRATPIDDVHYAGSFAFFGTELPAEPNAPPRTDHQQPRFLVNLTDTVQRLKRTQELKDDSALSVQLVAVPFADKFEREDTEIVLTRIEILITPVIVKSPQR